MRERVRVRAHKPAHAHVHAGDRGQRKDRGRVLSRFHAERGLDLTGSNLRTLRSQPELESIVGHLTDCTTQDPLSFLSY